MRLLMSGLDTVEAAYYFRPILGCRRISPPLVKPVRHSAHLGSVTRLLALGAKEFLHAGDGTASGYRFETLQHASRVIADWIGFYNHQRFHQTLGMKIPAEAYALRFSNLAPRPGPEAGA